MISHELTLRHNVPTPARIPCTCKKNMYGEVHRIQNTKGIRTTRITYHVYASNTRTRLSVGHQSSITLGIPCLTTPCPLRGHLNPGLLAFCSLGRCTQTAYQLITVAPRPTNNKINHQSNETNNNISEPTNNQ